MVELLSEAPGSSDTFPLIVADDSDVPVSAETSPFAVKVENAEKANENEIESAVIEELLFDTMGRVIEKFRTLIASPEMSTALEIETSASGSLTGE